MQITRSDVPMNIFNSLVTQHGEHAAIGWVDGILELIENLSNEWGFIPTGTLSGGTKSLCITGTHFDRKAVLKISPVPEMGNYEIEALAAWQGHRVPQIIAVHGDTSTFLMEYLEPADDHASLGNIFDLASMLHSREHATYNFPSLHQNIDMRFGWARKRKEAQECAEYAADIEEARIIADQLLATNDKVSLLHGDFQMKNIINTPLGPHAIDPMPCIGDSLFDLALWLGCSSHDMTLGEALLDCEQKMHTDDYKRFLLWLWCVEVLEQTTAKTAIAKAKRQIIKQAMATHMELSV